MWATGYHPQALLSTVAVERYLRERHRRRLPPRPAPRRLLVPVHPRGRPAVCRDGTPGGVWHHRFGDGLLDAVQACWGCTCRRLHERVWCRRSICFRRQRDPPSALIEWRDLDRAVWRRVTAHGGDAATGPRVAAWGQPCRRPGPARAAAVIRRIRPAGHRWNRRSAMLARSPLVANVEAGESAEGRPSYSTAGICICANHRAEVETTRCVCRDGAHVPLPAQRRRPARAVQRQLAGHRGAPARRAPGRRPPPDGADR